MEKLFQDLFNRETFGYTLFGDKPMSWANYSTTLFDNEDIPSKSGLRFRKRWEVWKKHAHTFPMTHYILIEGSYFSVLTLFGDPGYSPLMIHSVHFVADHKHPETLALQQKYRKMRGDISAIYAKGDFLEITLSKLTKD